MSPKKAARMRRALRTRMKIREQGSYRLCVNRTARHTYAQITSPSGDQTFVWASTTQPELRQSISSTGNAEAAAAVGRAIAEKAKQAGITHVAFDRSGYRYHGRVKALADAAREGGLNF